MDQRILGAGAGLLAAFAMPGPSRIVALGWLGSHPPLPVLLMLAAVAFAAVTGGALLIWKILTRQWPPREVTSVLLIVVGVRMIVDVVRMMGFWML